MKLIRQLATLALGLCLSVVALGASTGCPKSWQPIVDPLITGGSGLVCTLQPVVFPQSGGIVAASCGEIAAILQKILPLFYRDSTALAAVLDANVYVVSTGTGPKARIAGRRDVADAIAGYIGGSVTVELPVSAVKR